MKFNEAQLEQAFIDLLGKEGYPHVIGEVISRATVEVYKEIFEQAENFKKNR